MNNELIPGIPEEIALECMIRLPYTCHHAASIVCRKWKNLIDGRDFYLQRKQTGNSHAVACLVQSYPARAQPDGQKSTGPPAYGVVVFDPRSGKWERLPPPAIYPNGLPLFCQLAGCEGKLVMMGGWDPESWDPVRHVFVYDFTKRQWRQGRDMPVARSFFAAGAVDGKVVVAGGHDESKNALKSAAVYDVQNDEWKELVAMTEERDECEGAVIGGEFWVVSGYGTDRQGGFCTSAEVYHSAAKQWRHIDGVWTAGKCPRACVGVGSNGKPVCWPEEETGVRTAMCAVGLGYQTLVAGSAYQGAPPSFFLGVGKGPKRKLEKIEVPEEFAGFVQSGCCVEI